MEIFLLCWYLLKKEVRFRESYRIRIGGNNGAGQLKN